MYVRVSVTPKARKESMIKTDDNRFTISVTEPAENNRANSRVLEMVRAEFPRAKRLRIVSGHHSRTKLISIDLEGE